MRIHLKTDRHASNASRSDFSYLPPPPLCTSTRANVRLPPKEPSISTIRTPKHVLLHWITCSALF